MKSLFAWECPDCLTLVLEYRRKKPRFCPSCKKANAMKSDHTLFTDERSLRVLKIERADYLGLELLPKDDPRQLKMPFAIEKGGLFCA